MTNVPPSVGNLRGAVDLSALVNRATAPAAPAQQGSRSELIFEATDATFNEVLDLSMSVPVIVDLWATWCEPCKQLSPVLEKVVTEYGGRLVLVTVDVDSNPQLTQAFQAQSIPTVAAVIAGRPVALFAGALPEQQVRDVLEQVLQLAEQNGVSGRIPVEGGQGGEAAEAGADGVEEAPAPLPPHHAEAYAAIEQGDYDTAIAEYRTAIAQDPRDTMAVAGLAQVSLLARLKGRTAADIRAAAADAPRDVDAQLLVADLDLSGGHVEDAFDRLLTAFATADAAGREAIRLRLLEYFEIAGVDDPRVVKARSRLAALLY